MLVIDALYKMSEFNETMSNDVFTTTTQKYNDDFEGLYSFLDMVNNEGYNYLYCYSSALADGNETETKYFIVPEICRCADEVRELTKKEKTKIVPEKFYDLINFVGLEFPFSFYIPFTSDGVD